MAKFVFFGLDGLYSSIALARLHQAGLSPALVVHGRERIGKPTPFLEWPCKPSSLDRFFLRLGQLSAPGRDPERSGLTALAHELGIDVISTDQVGSTKAHKAIARTSADVFVVAGFSHLLPKSVLELARLGGLNLHPGRLPGQRGPAPLFWALKSAERRLGWTIHLLDSGEDTGAIASEGELERPPGASGQEILAELANAAAPALISAVHAMIDGTLVTRAQPEEGQGRCPRPALVDRRLDTSRTAAELHDFVTGCAGSYGLYAEVAGDRFFVRSAISFDAAAKLDYEFVLLGDRLLLACNPGIVELELAPDGAVFSADYQDEHEADR